MKKSILAIVAILVLTVSGLALAQMDKSKDMMGGGMMGGGMMDKGMMDGKMMGGGMMHGMMKMMMEKSVVATSDGGVVVVTANKMSKYDKDLNLVKEIELTMPTMEEMQSMCPMMGGMKGDVKEGVMPSNTDASAPVSADEHTSHHPENK